MRFSVEGGVTFIFLLEGHNKCCTTMFAIKVSLLSFVGKKCHATTNCSVSMTKFLTRLDSLLKDNKMQEMRWETRYSIQCQNSLRTLIKRGSVTFQNLCKKNKSHSKILSRVSKKNPKYSLGCPEIPKYFVIFLTVCHKEIGFW